MPPQQTNVPPEPAPAGRGLDVSIASASLTTLAPAGPFRDGPLAAPSEAWTDKRTARPPALSPWRADRLLARCWQAFRALARRGSAASLSDLNGRQLMDIGLTPDEIHCIDARRAVDRLRDSMLFRGLL